VSQERRHRCAIRRDDDVEVERALCDYTGPSRAWISSFGKRPVVFRGVAASAGVSDGPRVSLVASPNDPPSPREASSTTSCVGSDKARTSAGIASQRSGARASERAAKARTSAEGSETKTSAMAAVTSGPERAVNSESARIRSSTRAARRASAAQRAEDGGGSSRSSSKPPMAA